MAFPGASHSRFEHSLGAMHIAGEASTHIILNSNNNINSTSIIDLMDSINWKTEIKKQIQLTRLAALLHDIRLDFVFRGFFNQISEFLVYYLQTQVFVFPI